MSGVNKQFEYLGLTGSSYDYTDKTTNINNKIAYMLDRSGAMFQYHNLPETIPPDKLEQILQTAGAVTIGRINGDLYAVNAGLGGKLDVYGNPTTAAVSVPYLNYNANWEINTDCVVIKNDSMCMGLLPLYYKYCTLLSENEITILLTMVNKRSQSLVAASDSQTINSAETYIKNLYAGKIGVIADMQLFENLKTLDRKTETDLQELIELEQYLTGSLYNEIGLSANYNMKKERLTTADIELNTDGLYPFVDNMLLERRRGVDAVNRLFSTEITVELNSAWDYRYYVNSMGVETMDETAPETETETDPETETETDPETEKEEGGTE